MPTPETQNYINQSRASGISDDQIRATLQAQGWAEADIAQALGSTSTVVAAGTKSIAPKVIAGLVALLIFGGAAYVMFTGDTKPVDDNQNIDEQPNNENQSTGNWSVSLVNAKCESYLTPEEAMAVKGTTGRFEWDIDHAYVNRFGCEDPSLSFNIEFYENESYTPQYLKQKIGCGLIYKDEECKEVSKNPEIYVISHEITDRISYSDAVSTSGIFVITCSYSGTAVPTGEAAVVKCIQNIQQNIQKNY